MSVKKNTVANYIGQFYVILIGIVIMPLYLKELGAVAFGLVGLYSVMQSWLRILDMGLSPMLARQVAHSRGNSESVSDLPVILRSLELIFLCIASIIFVVVLYGRHDIAVHWLMHDAQLSIQMVGFCLVLMAAMCGLRWFVDLYSGGIRGLEQQVWLNKCNIFIVTLQYVGGWAFLHWISHDVVLFFSYQLFTFLLNVLIVRQRFYSLMHFEFALKFSISWAVLKKTLPFAMATAYTSSIWIVTTQFDKLIFSHILPLSEYGYFCLLYTSPSPRDH
jgi:O-antigen/teichoic acid export membrane protein